MTIASRHQGSTASWLTLRQLGWLLLLLPGLLATGSVRALDTTAGLLPDQSAFSDLDAPALAVTREVSGQHLLSRFDPEGDSPAALVPARMAGLPAATPLRLARPPARTAPNARHLHTPAHPRAPPHYVL